MYAFEITDEQLESFLFKIGRPRYKTRRSSSSPVEEAKTFGGILYDSVFRDGVLSCLRSSISETIEKDVGLRLRLRLVGVPELSELPWEFLYMRTHNQFVSLSTYTPVVRYFELPEKIRPLQVSSPLRILVVISSPTDFPPLDVDREWSNVCAALQGLVDRNLVELKRLEAPRLTQLDRYLTENQVHILHFIGHGGFNNDSQSGELIFQDGQGRGRNVSAEQIGTILNAHRSLRLVVLNACDGARANRTDPFAGTAQTLIQQGIPAVIGMQFEITDDAAIAFSGEFYSSVAIGEPIDRSLADARRAIYADGNQVEWATPVLYMRSPDGRIFEVATNSEVEKRKAESDSVRQARDAAEAEQRRLAEQNAAINDVVNERKPISPPVKKHNYHRQGVTIVALVIGVAAVTMALDRWFPWPNLTAQKVASASAPVTRTSTKYCYCHIFCTTDSAFDGSSYKCGDSRRHSTTGGASYRAAPSSDITMCGP